MAPNLASERRLLMTLASGLNMRENYCCEIKDFAWIGDGFSLENSEGRIVGRRIKEVCANDFAFGD